MSHIVKSVGHSIFNENTIMKKEREDALKGLKSGENIVDQKIDKIEPINITPVKNANKNKQHNIRLYINLISNIEVQLINDAGKKGINNLKKLSIPLGV